MTKFQLQFLNFEWYNSQLKIMLQKLPSDKQNYQKSLYSTCPQTEKRSHFERHYLHSTSVRFKWKIFIDKLQIAINESIQYFQKQKEILRPTKSLIHIYPPSRGLNKILIPLKNKVNYWISISFSSAFIFLYFYCFLILTSKII